MTAVIIATGRDLWLGYTYRADTDLIVRAEIESTSNERESEQ